MEPIVKGILTWSQLLKESFHGASYLMNPFNMPARAEVDVKIDSEVTRFKYSVPKLMPPPSLTASGPALPGTPQTSSATRFSGKMCPSRSPVRTGPFAVSP